MGEQAYVLLDLEMPLDAVVLLQEAQQFAGTRIPALLRALLRAWLRSAEAEAYAAAGMRKECLLALESAALLLPDDTDNTETPYISLTAEHFARWRGHCLARIGDPTATDQLLDALDAMPKDFVRARAGLEGNLARALLIQGEAGEALTHARSAYALAQQTGSVRQLRQIQALRKRAA